MSTVKGDFSVSFGARLREVREQKGLSQDAFGALAGVTKKTQGLYESGKGSPDAEYLEKLRQAGCDTTYILTGHHGTNDEHRPAYRVEPETRQADGAPADRPPPVMGQTITSWRENMEMMIDVLVSGPVRPGMSGRVVLQMVDKMTEMEHAGLKVSADMLETMLDNLIKGRP